MLPDGRVFKESLQNRVTRGSVSANLYAEFGDCRKKGFAVWAIVDPASHPTAWPEFSRLAKQSQVTNLFHGSGQTTDESVSPLLLSIQPEQVELTDRLVDLASNTPAVVWLSTRLDGATLLSCLQLKLRGALADRNPIILRYYDPRVLAALVRILDDGQKQTLGRDIQTWWWLDREGSIGNWNSGEKPCNSIAPRPSEAPITLTDPQVDSLLSVSFADRVVDLMNKNYASLIRRLEGADRYRWVAASIERARAVGLFSEFDCANFTAVALHQGRDFHEHGDWPALMHQVRRGELKFSDAIEQWEAGHA